MENKLPPILITGADTGIGRMTVMELASRGYSVYAGCYVDSSISEFEVVDNIDPIKLDVTNDKDISNLVEWVKNKGKGLYGLVNNAGISDYWPLIESDDESFHRVMNINLYGVLRVTRALIPFIIENKGRILSMGSLSGTIPTRLLGSYSASKFAVEALTDVFHSETKQFGVIAITIKPGNFQSDISKAVVPILKSRMGLYEKSLYKDQLKPMFDNLDSPTFQSRAQHDKPDIVVNTIIEALTVPNPKTKYLVTNTKDTEAALGWMFRVISQLNQNHPNALSKEKLHEMLDQQLAKFQSR